MLKRALVIGIAMVALAQTGACKKSGKKKPKVDCQADCTKMHQTCGAELIKAKIGENETYKKADAAKKADILKRSVKNYGTVFHKGCISACEESRSSPILAKCAKLTDCKKFARCVLGMD